jgi:hypothetical protein
MGLRAGLDAVKKKTVSLPWQESSPDSLAVHAIPRHYTNWANPAPRCRSSFSLWLKIRIFNVYKTAVGDNCDSRVSDVHTSSAFTLVSVTYAVSGTCRSYRTPPHPVSCRLPTAAVRVRDRVKSSGICGRRWHWGWCASISLPIIHSTDCSTSVIQGWYRMQINGLSNSGLEELCLLGCYAVWLL